MKRALITGITGQDDSYLAEFLQENGYEVHGIKRRASSFNTQRVDHLYKIRPTPAKRDLGWIPQNTLQEMVWEMMASDQQAAIRNTLLSSHGHAVHVAKCS